MHGYSYKIVLDIKQQRDETSRQYPFGSHAGKNHWFRQPWILERWRTSVGTRAVPNSLSYWDMSSGALRTASGSNSPARRSWIKQRDENMSAEARGSWEPREGVGSSLGKKPFIPTRTWRRRQRQLLTQERRTGLRPVRQGLNVIGRIHTWERVYFD